MHHPMPFGKVPVSCCRTFLWHLPGARMQAGHLQADFRRPWALQMWGIYGNITHLCLNCLQFTSNRIYWLLFWVEMSSPSCLPLHDWHVRGWPRIRLAKWLTHHATTATTAATKQLPLSSFLPCELVVSLAHWTSCVCVSSCVLFLLKQLSPRTQTDTLQNNQEHPRAVSRAGVFAKIHEQLVTCCFWSSWAEYLWCLDGNKQPSLE